MWKEELNEGGNDLTDDEICCKELEEALFDYELEKKITSMIGDERMEELEKTDEYRKWVVETGKSGETGRKYITKMIMQAMTKYLSQGVLQLTIEKVMKEPACTDAVKKRSETAIVAEFRKTLAPFRVHIDIVPKIGAMELPRIRHNFDIEPEVEVKDMKVMLEETILKSVTFGSLFTKMKIFAVTTIGRIELCSIKGNLKFPQTITV